MVCHQLLVYFSLFPAVSSVLLNLIPFERFAPCCSNMWFAPCFSNTPVPFERFTPCFSTTLLRSSDLLLVSQISITLVPFERCDPCFANTLAPFERFAASFSSTVLPSETSCSLVLKYSSLFERSTPVSQPLYSGPFASQIL